MTVRLGMFTMPFHHPARDYADFLEEDQEAIILADRLGFSEAFVGPAQAMAALDGTAGDGGDAAVLAVRRRDPSEMRC